MAIDGVRRIKKNAYSIFYIDNFSDEFKHLIREQLQGIFHGFSEADSLPEYYSYKFTLESFIERYRSKSHDIKKGMIAELLSHMILYKEFDGLNSLSILKNKEERSIKKGFDIIYYNTNHNNLWYSEVKSGHRAEKQTSSECNSSLLDRAKKGIASMIGENRNSLWDSALIDVTLMIKESEGRLDFKRLLANDSPSINLDQKKNVILISSLYHNLTEEIEENSVSEFLMDTITEDIFNQIIVISIQKKAFETVALFLNDEITKS